MNLLRNHTEHRIIDPAHTLIVDAPGILHRAAHKAKGSLRAAQMLVTVAVTRLLKTAPTCGVLIAVFDGLDSGDERRAIYPDYKRNRDTGDTPDPVLNGLKNMAPALFQQAKFTVVKSTNGYEGDDVLAALASAALSSPESRVSIASDDKDMLALLCDARVTILRHSERGGKFEQLTGATSRRLKIAPTQMADFLAICGDSSDNIPGAMGIGEMRALALLKEYGSLAGILHAANDGELSGAALRAFTEPESLRRIEISKELVRLRAKATWEVL